MSKKRSVRVALAVTGVVLALGATTVAQARGGVDFSIGIATPGVVIGGGVPMYAAPPPVYYAPPPQPAYYPPAPMYSAPRPVYYAPPPPVYVQPRPIYYGPGYGRPWGPPPGHWDRGRGGNHGWHGR